MLKRLEVYADAGLMGLLCSSVVFAVLSLGVGRYIARLFGEGFGGMLSLLGPAALVGTVIAIWVTWILHHRTTLEPMSRTQSVSMSRIALVAMLVAGGLVAAWLALGSDTIVMGTVGTVLLLMIAVWLFADAFIDIFKTHEHITIDVVRVLTLGILGASLVASLISPAAAGTDADITAYVVIGTAYMTLAALLANAYDELVSWRSRTHVTHAPLSPSV